jgi:hypothetical protein
MQVARIVGMLAVRSPHDAPFQMHELLTARGLQLEPYEVFLGRGQCAHVQAAGAQVVGKAEVVEPLALTASVELGSV